MRLDTACTHSAPSEPSATDDAEPSASLDAATPDYRERLAYGTDQGRWLMEQVGTQGVGERPKRRGPKIPARAYHETQGAEAPASIDMESGERRPWKPLVAVLGVASVLLVVALLRYTGEERAL